MQLPRPLLIAIAVLVLLALVGGCGALVAPDGEIDDIRGGLTDFLDGLAPDPEPVALNAGNTSCLNGDQLQMPFTGTCQIEIAPSGSFRRELELQVIVGTVQFEVDQVVGGESIDSDPQTVPFVDDEGNLQVTVSVVVSRDDSAELSLRCLAQGGCILAVNPE
jgi:hypothetical protein